MTTRHSFLKKVFEENEIAKPIYENYEFDSYSPEKIYLLEKLSLITKYKSIFKSILLRKKISDREKLDYLLVNKQSITYSEYIKFNVMLEKNENNFINIFYIVGGLNFLMFAYFVAIRPPNYSIIKEMSFSVLFSLISGYAFHSYNKISYKKELNELYETLEKRLNDYPQMKDNYNKNFLSDEDYDEIIADQYACIEFRFVGGNWYILSSDGLKQS